MKKGCILLLMIVFAVYIRQGYLILSTENPINNFTEGSLSSIAEEVTAIPLETNNQCKLTHARLIKRDKNELFLICNRELYHFNCAGKFINKITHNHRFLVSDYVIDPINKQIIILDNDEKIHYYNYAGELLTVKNISAKHPWNKLIKLAYYNNHIWATTENTTPRDNKLYLEKWLYKFDINFQEVEANRLTNVDLGRLNPDCNFSPEPAVANNQVYAHSPSMQPDELLHDTLYLINKNNMGIRSHSSVLPLRISKRFLLSMYHNPLSENMNYIFCFDQKEKCAYNLKGGFEDNFYHTGKIPELQALDMHNSSFCYCKSGDEVKQAFPDRKENDNPVLFIVKMKG